MMERDGMNSTGQQGMTAALCLCGVVLLAILGAWQFGGEDAVGRRSVRTGEVDFSAFRKVLPSDVGFREVQRFPAGVANAAGVCSLGSGICVVGEGGGRVLDQGGEETGRLAFSGAAACVAAGKDGRVYVGLSDRVIVCRPSGEQVAEWRCFGESANLTSIAAVDDGVVVADSGTRVIWRLDPEGQVVATIGTKGKVAEGLGLRFVVPSPYFDVADGGEGTFWVTNPGERRVLLISREGTVLREWGTSGMGLGAFCGCCNPAHIAVHPGGTLITSEKGIPRVSEYASEGKFRTLVASAETFGVSVLPGDLAVTDTGRIVVLDVDEQILRVFERTPSGGVGE